MGKQHILAIPYPAQGHVIPLLELSQRLVAQSFKVTFVNTEFNHKRVVNALSDQDNLANQIHLVSIPDGMEPSEDRNNLVRLTEGILKVMPGKLEELIRKINRSDDKKITCVIADQSMGWALEVAKKMIIRGAAFSPPSAAMLASAFSIPELINDGIINSYGTPVGNQMIQLSPNMPLIGGSNLVWACMGELTEQKFIFEFMVRNNKVMEVADWIICNSSDKLEPGAFALFTNLLPIGPLLARHRLGKPAGCFWPEDSTCLEWLDQQPTHSVIYVAYGSFTVFDKIQFQELALGLELTGRPFLWVVRPDLTHESNDAYPMGFRERVATHGRLVGWAPQQEVLSHPSVACFLSHCGWNSTMEGLSNGIPFLCWPYFADQFLNESYICDTWKIGLRFNRDESGIVRKGEIKDKVEHLLNDKTFRERALDLKEVAAESVNEGGCSHNNFNKLIEWMKTEKSCSNHRQA
ncbi:UDP-glycosyltransferase 83A1-like [Diospyros lotus]|uniref:UDP-glycosyltransferase 83A1-like n=1 Tax=Diospyros lotus TaxID=55363 RepID=UPI002255BEAE|nr:UDP-glycosyltransferase 83A1-like [Diospyros lotus]